MMVMLTQPLSGDVHAPGVERAYNVVNMSRKENNEKTQVYNVFLS